MSKNKNVEVSEVEIGDALQQICELSNGRKGVVLNKNSAVGIDNVLSGSEPDIEKVASNPENSKVIKNNDPALEKDSKKANTKKQVSSVKPK